MSSAALHFPVSSVQHFSSSGADDTLLAGLELGSGAEAIKVGLGARLGGTTWVRSICLRFTSRDKLPTAAVQHVMCLPAQ